MRHFMVPVVSFSRSRFILKGLSRNIQTHWISTSHNKLENSEISLKNIFDDNTLWRGLNKQNYQHNDKLSSSDTYKERFLSTIAEFSKERSNENVGLFKNPYLTDPKGLKEFSRESLNNARALTELMKTDTSTEGLRNYIINLDKLSDTLCRVIDLCEFIRSAHPDERFVKAAQLCHEEMFEFMNVLNTDVTLYNTLKKVLTDDNILKTLSKEEIKVGKILLEDFEKSGICMTSEIRDKFISLSQDISLIGQDFINSTGVARKKYIFIKAKELEDSGITIFILSRLKMDSTGRHYKIPTYGALPLAILKTSSSENIRKQIWIALHSCPDEQITRLTHLIKLRSILANLMGKSSFAEYQLDGKMAKTPQGVKKFIGSLVESTRPLAAREVQFISDQKCIEMNKESPSDMPTILNIVRPWDRDYYGWLSRQNARKVESINENEPISPYFTLGGVLEGLSDIFRNAYGLELKPVIPQVGETWSPEVRIINVVSETEGIVGVIYCDLFERVGKTQNPAHFTVCCSRQTYAKENDESIMQIGVDSKGVRYQLPIISLVCNFSKTIVSSDKILCLLELHEIETLFHEMGHAIHSMLGRTRLQNISGTRCPTDFVELPSILMEHFARDTRVLRNIGVHYKTGKTIPEKLIVQNLEEQKFLQNCETFAQAKMAMLDQELHGANIIQNINTIDVVKIYQDLERHMGVLVDNKSNWCGRFGHLYGYGATYYSYLLDRAIASKVWEKLFSQDPYNRIGGTQFRDKVLKWGGLKDPWTCIADVLEQPTLENGDSEAMKYFGNTHDL
ncbi:similar to Saccharomyces cerevisiae YKL134C 37165 Mitochondrial intermediate peptidase [Maudiozyma barnettii]|uniref:Mitochondrial intermediate peptidase n=1 Tax=Maudiozyma barnettii TaxID=61262 RepID=A0A8H2VKP2_9SACH|nr:metalloendopeptidase [Kazachstania barnettii]CAB4257125.1 similar to Saccharomyces cerevisiae YKL134C 37165 Mitochondrial intermediate peptidase [Kazachstania barnettii]CAD1779495.1 similar to Saccharomyces cerevisiae YKL134C 37165 Mitochondrial intermediate peptidase [Kazachstania barnettii]